MTTVAAVTALLDQFAPSRLAEEWDNVGLLVGYPHRPVRRIMTCLTITPATVAEAVAKQADLIVSHHPLPFRPVRRLTAESTEGRLLLDLVAAGIAVVSPHTAFDSARAGINRRLADGLALTDIMPLIPAAVPPEAPDIGAGRWGCLAEPGTLLGVANRLKQFLAIPRMRLVGRVDQRVTRVAVACGSGGSLLDATCRHDCHCLVTGEAGFHTCLAAEARGVGLVLAGHYPSERFAVEHLATYLAEQVAGTQVWASACECDPITWI